MSRRALGTVGLTLDDVVKVTVHLQHLKRDFDAYDAVYARRFHEPIRCGRRWAAT